MQQPDLKKRMRSFMLWKETDMHHFGKKAVIALAHGLAILPSGRAPNRLAVCLRRV